MSPVFSPSCQDPVLIHGRNHFNLNNKRDLSTTDPSLMIDSSRNCFSRKPVQPLQKSRFPGSQISACSCLPGPYRTSGRLHKSCRLPAYSDEFAQDLHLFPFSPNQLPELTPVASFIQLCSVITYFSRKNNALFKRTGRCGSFVIRYRFRLFVSDRCLCCCQSCDRYTER